MRTLMRLQPSQVQKSYKYTVAGSINFLDLSLHKQAGVKTFKVFIVGAAGAKSGIAYNYNGSSHSGRAAGGGGGSLHLSGNLEDLPDLVGVAVGATPTASGANGANNGKAGNGADGG